MLLTVLLLAVGGCTEDVRGPADGTEFAVHFIDVGQADAALVVCDGEVMLIDGGNREDSQLIYSYLKQENIAHLDYIVATHAHEDHIGGLPGALNYATVDTALCSVDEYDSGVFKTFVDQLAKQGKEITVTGAGDTFRLGSADVQVLGPVWASDDPNNMSVVLRIEYGETSFLFTGDAEREEEEDILDAGFDLESTVLKVGHHGSENSTTYPFLREVMPEYAVISVGEGNSYGHPTPEALGRLRDAGVTVLRTDERGTIICTSDGQTVSFAAQRDEEEDPLGTKMEYVLNTSSKKFHLPTCGGVKDIKEKNRAAVFETRSELVSRGYAPCGNCKP
ncbi:MAG: MBL fold metallo-hydrolase [Oscillospiraceae bacterium]|nr:MBL fold metallo-hydrolase [Oscillospiraceae bacterium]